MDGVGAFGVKFGEHMSYPCCAELPPKDVTVKTRQVSRNSSLVSITDKTRKVQEVVKLLRGVARYHPYP